MFKIKNLSKMKNKKDIKEKDIKEKDVKQNILNENNVKEKNINILIKQLDYYIF
ncbi:MAG: hypothetical protein RSB87_04795 [Clostridia bacterium]